MRLVRLQPGVPQIVMVTNHLLPRQLLILICDCHDEQHNMNSDPRGYKHS